MIYDKSLKRPTIHSTFLDAYDTEQPSKYGDHANWSEHYVDMAATTKPYILLSEVVSTVVFPPFRFVINMADYLWNEDDDENIILPRAFNFDITKSENRTLIPLPEIVGFIGEHHSWPHKWYNETILDTSTNMGFAFALESGRSRLLSHDYLNFQRSAVCSSPYINCKAEEIKIRAPNPIIDFNCHDIWQCPDNPLLKTYRSDTGTVDLSVHGIVTLKSVYPTSAMNRNARSTASATSDSSAWVSMQINVTQPINTLLFDYSFLSQNTEGLLSVFVDNQLVHMADQQFAEDGINSSKEVAIGDVQPGTHSLSFRLDPFADVQSVLEISNIQTGVLTLVDSTEAKIYLSANDSFIISNSGATVFGGTGNEVVTLGAGVSGVILDKNIERVALAGDSSNYSFKQTGNKLNVYNIADSRLLASAPLQGDAGGTQFKFSNGVFDAKLSAGVMSLGGATVSTTVGAHTH